MEKNISKIEPFEICSIRPPTENYSLTFRLTRNCGWNKCIFCPVYKLGAKFSRRSIDDVKKDVDRASAINSLLTDIELDGFYSRGNTVFEMAAQLISKTKHARKKDQVQPVNEQASDKDASYLSSDCNYEEDERLKWFATWFKEVPTIEDSVNHVLSWRISGGQTCFLGDANSLLLPPDYLTEVIQYIKNTFPTLERFTVYGRTRSAAKKKPEDMIAFRKAGLHRIHFGVESGSDTVLSFMKKGVTAEEHIEGCRKTKDAGISCSIYVMPGLGGMKWSEEHALETARVISESGPDFVRLRSLEIFPKTGLSLAKAEGNFIEATEEQIARELRLLIENIRCSTIIVSDSASNLLDLNGTLPVDREKILDTIDEYLALTPREKLIFSFSSRFHSFMGQYGGISHDLLNVLYPYISGGTIDISSAPNNEITKIIHLIRSKLMP